MYHQTRRVNPSFLLRANLTRSVLYKSPALCPFGRGWCTKIQFLEISTHLTVCNTLIYQAFSKSYNSTPTNQLKKLEMARKTVFFDTVFSFSRHFLADLVFV